MEQNRSAAAGMEHGADMMEKQIPVLRETGNCPVCYAGGFVTGTIITAMLESNLSEDEVNYYLTDLMVAIYAHFLLLRKEAGHEDPPKSPDKRTLN